MNTLQDRHDELLTELTSRLNRAELALNRHGFKDDGKEWHAPPAWATLVEVRRALRTAERMIAQLTQERDMLRDQAEQPA